MKSKNSSCFAPSFTPVITWWLVCQSPSEKYELRQLGWWNSQYIYIYIYTYSGKYKIFQTTNQSRWAPRSSRTRPQHSSKGTPKVKCQAFVHVPMQNGCPTLPVLSIMLSAYKITIKEKSHKKFYRSGEFTQRICIRIIGKGAWI